MYRFRRSWVTHYLMYIQYMVQKGQNSQRNDGVKIFWQYAHLHIM